MNKPPKKLCSSTLKKCQFLLNEYIFRHNSNFISFEDLLYMEINTLYINIEVLDLLEL